MTSSNKCSGCGEQLQITNNEERGYTPKENSTLCMRCFKLVHYGEKTNNLQQVDIVEYLNKVKNSDGDVILVIDVSNPFETLITNINKYVNYKRLLFLVNKTDILPKAIPQSTIIEWIDNIATSKNIKFSSIVIASTTKNLNIDSLYDYMKQKGGSFSIIGYSNVGKSSLIRSIFKSRLKDVKNTISNTLGTTTEVIEVELDNFKIYDYPGFLLKGSYQNLLNPEQMEAVMAKKEIRILNFQPTKPSMYSIAKGWAFFFIETPSPIQFQISNELDVARVNAEKPIDETFECHDIEITGDRKDIIISGLGKFTVKKRTKGKLFLPKGIRFNIVDSIYN